MNDLGVTISLPFRFGAYQGEFDGTTILKGTGGSLAETSDEHAIWKDRVFVALLTAVRERVMRPSYGTDVLAAMFEPETYAEATVASSVRAAFSDWLPTLTVKTVDVTYNSSTGYLDVDVEYILPSGASDNFASRIRTSTFNQYGEIVRES